MRVSAAAADAVDGGRLHERQPGERPDRAHGAEGEGAPLARRDAGHERQVIVGPAPRVALAGVVAHAAVLDGLRVGHWRARERLLEGGAHVAEVRRVPRRREGLLAPVAEDEGHALREDPLRAEEQLGVEAELEQRTGLRGARELRVGGLVRPGAQRGRDVNAAEKVGHPEPSRAVPERALVDDLDATLHRVERVLGGVRRVGHNLLDAPRDPQRREIRGLVRRGRAS